jgi:phosphate ABC transporter phosphate-binding protein
VVLHRSDTSGTTYIWADYLSKVSSDWKAKVGAAKTVKWPCGEGRAGSEAMCARLRTSEGTIGYIDLTHALHERIEYAMVRNKEGEYIDPSARTVNEAVRSAIAKDKIASDGLLAFTDQPGTDVYPITGVTFAIVYVDQRAEKGKQIKEFLRWAITKGQRYADEMSYAPLPKVLIDRAQKRIDEIALK